MSTNTGFAPACTIAPAVAKNVNGTVMTSSPGPIPSASSASSSASEPDAHPMACRTPQYSAALASNALTSSPRMKYCESITRSTAAVISFLIPAYCARRSRSGTGGVTNFCLGSSSVFMRFVLSRVFFPVYPAAENFEKANSLKVSPRVPISLLMTNTRERISGHNISRREIHSGVLYQYKHRQSAGAKLPESDPGIPEFDHSTSDVGPPDREFRQRRGRLGHRERLPFG